MKKGDLGEGIGNGHRTVEPLEKEAKANEATE